MTPSEDRAQPVESEHANLSPEVTRDGGDTGRELARHRDPSLKERQRRENLLEQVRSRRMVRWVPASEVLRGVGSRAAERMLETVDRRRAAIERTQSDRAAADWRRRLGTSMPLRGAGAAPSRTAVGIDR
ncbi:MAG TPA: hypothetical protein VGC18_06490 [Lacisediminihabitans sp.]|jgi:hypothetical protein|uniref:hypothetical protein n=1 Tax=Lacisediminihabitans sp. TaxID=2787631 RepID=UPI002ED8DF2C